MYYASSPALVGDRLIVYMKKLIALDTRTGEVAWSQRDVDKNSAGILPAKLAGVDCVVSQQGEVVRVSDGAMLYRNPRKIVGDTGWAAPVIVGDTVYLPWSGVSNVLVFDFSKCSGEEWTPKVSVIDGLANNRRPDGAWLDRWTASSPVVLDGLYYNVDIYSTFYCADINAKKLVYRMELPFAGMFHYNAVPVAASPTLIGKYLYVLDNQGTCVVLEPGRAFGLVATNRIGTQLKRE